MVMVIVGGDGDDDSMEDVSRPVYLYIHDTHTHTHTLSVYVSLSEGGRRVSVYPATPDIIVSNLSVALRPNEKDLERFQIVDSPILMLTD
jgi:hypothetical protein